MMRFNSVKIYFCYLYISLFFKIERYKYFNVFNFEINDYCYWINNLKSFRVLFIIINKYSLGSHILYDLHCL